MNWKDFQPVHRYHIHVVQGSISFQENEIFTFLYNIDISIQFIKLPDMTIASNARPIQWFL